MAVLLARAELGVPCKLLTDGLLVIKFHTSALDAAAQAPAKVQHLLVSSKQ